MRLDLLSLASTLLSVVSAATPDFLSKIPVGAELCGPNNDSTDNAVNWCKKAASEINSGCCLVDTAKWSESKAHESMQEWCDSVSANVAVKSLNCSPDTDYSDPYNLGYSDSGDDDDSSGSTSLGLGLGSEDSTPSENEYNTPATDDKVLSRSAIVGIVMGVIGALFVFIVVVHWLCLARRKSQPPMTTSTTWRVPDRGNVQPPRRNPPVLPVRGSTPPPVYSAPPPAYHA